jgi:hypothetical protein
MHEYKPVPSRPLSHGEQTYITRIQKDYQHYIETKKPERVNEPNKFIFRPAKGKYGL